MGIGWLHVHNAYYGQCFRGVAFECYNVQKLSL